VDNPVAQDWLKRTIEFARDRYGDKLVAAIVHPDEGKYHVHLWFHNDGKNVKPMLAAHKAAAEWKAAGGVRGGGEAAASGNTALLNEYQEFVGKHVGLDRKGPNPEAANETWRQRRRREAKEDREAAAKEREAVRKKAQQVTQIAQENENFNRRREAEVREKEKAADAALADATRKDQAAEAALKVGEGFMSKAQAARRQMLAILLDSKAKGQVTSVEAEEMARTIGVSPQLLAAAEAARHAGRAFVI
jgi:flagellar biosynthesis GTPase FlhF